MMRRVGGLGTLEVGVFGLLVLAITFATRRQGRRRFFLLFSTRSSEGGWLANKPDGHPFKWPSDSRYQPYDETYIQSHRTGVLQNQGKVNTAPYFPVH
jgi:hypothetical protein